MPQQFPVFAGEADVLASFRFDGFPTLAALRALMMLFFLVVIIAMALWRVMEVADPARAPE